MLLIKWQQGSNGGFSGHQLIRYSSKKLLYSWKLNGLKHITVIAKCWVIYEYLLKRVGLNYETKQIHITFNNQVIWNIFNEIYVSWNAMECLKVSSSNVSLQTTLRGGLESAKVTRKLGILLALVASMSIQMASVLVGSETSRTREPFRRVSLKIICK